MVSQSAFDTMGPTASWEYIGKISPAIPALRRLVDHMEGTVNNYRRYKKHTVRSTEDDIASLMVVFQESALYRRVDGRQVCAKERFVDIWARGFNTVSKGESLTRWFKNRSELQLTRYNDVGDYNEPTRSELEEMELEDDYGSTINLHSRHMWEFNDDAPSRCTSSER